jgi:hypothetical protein|tara:strand:+ start:566 stop:1168 length:603 start_codon:yes stop_codon:yes gene_type:complete
MKNLNRFIISPTKKRYNNTVEIGNKELVVNTKIETFQSVSKEAIVIETPINIKTNIKSGDRVIVHHNIFRRYYDIRGNEKNGGCYFKDDLFFCDMSQIYLYGTDELKTNLDYCFVSPVYNRDRWSNLVEEPLVGIMKYSNDYLINKNIKEGDVVNFSPNSEFEFVIDGEKLYCMKSNDIAITYEYERNKEKYNPSWAQGC